MARAIVVEYKNYQGLRMTGAVPLEAPGFWHIDEISWLTACVESGGKFGCVMNYDGTGMTAGIHQAIAVYPSAIKDNNARNDQGPLWKLLARLGGLGITGEIEDHLEAWGCTLTADGKCVSSLTGDLVSGPAIRRMFNGDSGGWMPLDRTIRKECVRWVKEFHTAFSDPLGFQTQLAYGHNAFEKFARSTLRYCGNEDFRKRSILDVFYGKKSLGVVREMSEEMGLAMAMAFSHAVNAPSKVLRILCRKVVDFFGRDVYYRDAAVAKRIIVSLGNTPFARWDDDLKNGRYQRTRNYAMKHWDGSLFEPDGIMPSNLK